MGLNESFFNITTESAKETTGMTFPSELLEWQCVRYLILLYGLNEDNKKYSNEKIELLEVQNTKLKELIAEIKTDNENLKHQIEVKTVNTRSKPSLSIPFLRVV